MKNYSYYTFCYYQHRYRGLEGVEERIQAESSQWLSYFNLIRNLPALFSALFITAYTDTGGRGVGLALPCLGGLLKALYVILALYLHAPVGYLMIGTCY